MASSSDPYAGGIVANPAVTTSSAATVPVVMPGAAMNPQAAGQIPGYTPSTINVTLTPGQAAALSQLANQAGTASSELSVPMIDNAPDAEMSSKAQLAQRAMPSPRANSLLANDVMGAQATTHGTAAGSSGVR